MKLNNLRRYSSFYVNYRCAITRGGFHNMMSAAVFSSSVSAAVFLQRFSKLILTIPLDTFIQWKHVLIVEIINFLGEPTDMPDVKQLYWCAGLQSARHTHGVRRYWLVWTPVTHVVFGYLTAVGYWYNILIPRPKGFASALMHSDFTHLYSSTAP